MAKITIIPASQNSTEFEPRNFTQVGGVFGTEIKPEDFLIPAEIPHNISENGVGPTYDGREPRFFRVR